MPRSACVVVPILAATATVALSAGAETLSVPGDYGTIQAAIDAAAPGDVVDVAAGSYSESITINKAVTVQGAGPGNSTINATDSHAVQTTDMTGARVSGFTLVGTGTGVTVMVEGPGSPADAEISDNEIQGSDTAIQFYGASGLFSGNTIVNLTGTEPLGISCMNGSSPRIVNNLFIGTSGVMSYYDSNPEIVNNTFIDGDTAIEFRASPIPVNPAVSEPFIINNLIVGSTTGLKALNGAVASEISNNLLWDVATPYDAVPQPPADLALEPLFADLNAGNYRLAEGSPGIDEGSDGPLVPDVDLDGNARPIDGDGDNAPVCDVGAYEYNPSSSSGQGGASSSGGGTGGSSSTSSGTGGSNAGSDSDTDTESGCGCRTAPSRAPVSPLWLLLGLAALGRRRR